ncbi:MAG: zf-HC2 domain-containing protein [Bryobacteraceae bacterium]|jgi:anti-sigma factor RsiW
MPHISDDQLELYLMGRLNEQELAPLEEHLLICEECRDRLEKTEAYIAAMRAILRRQQGPEE